MDMRLEQGTLVIDDAVVAAVRAYGERMAEALKHAMELGGLTSAPPDWAAQELAAACQIVQWERQGILQQFTPALPSAEVACDDVRRRILEAAPRPEDEHPTPLADQVFRTWLTQVHWGASAAGTDVPVVGWDDAFIDDLAALVWECRDLLKNRPRMTE